MVDPNNVVKRKPHEKDLQRDLRQSRRMLMDRALPATTSCGNGGRYEDDPTTIKPIHIYICVCVRMKKHHQGAWIEVYDFCGLWLGFFSALAAPGDANLSANGSGNGCAGREGGWRNCFVKSFVERGNNHSLRTMCIVCWPTVASKTPFAFWK